MQNEEKVKEREHDSFLKYLDHKGFIEIPSLLISRREDDRLFVCQEIGLCVLLRWEENKGSPPFYYYELFFYSFSFIPTKVSYGSCFSDMDSVIQRYNSSGSNGRYCSEDLGDSPDLTQSMQIADLSAELVSVKSKLEKMEGSAAIADKLLCPD